MSAAHSSPRPALSRWAAALWPAFLVAGAATAGLVGLLDVDAWLECTLPGRLGALDPLGLYSIVFLALWAVGSVAALAAIGLLAGRQR